MKSIKIKILEKMLRFMAKVVIWRHKPIIVGVTGSVGKTSTKEAISLVLSAKYRVKKSLKNYNNEIGLPLAIIGVDSGGSSLLKWLIVILKWKWAVLFCRDYPEVLVLEMGVDRPGDMDYLLNFIQPAAGVITNIGSSHIEFFKTKENIAKEKGKLIEALPKDGLAVLNADDNFTAKLKNRTKAKVLTFGFQETANFRTTDNTFNYLDDKPDGITFKLNYDGKVIPIRLRNILAPHQIYAALAAVAVGIHFKINLVEVANVLEKFATPYGRTNLIDGIKGSYIIDDTYNASPVSALAALDVLERLKAKRKLVAIGDMLELGDETKEGHRQIGKRIFEMKADECFLVGNRMKTAFEELEKLGFAKDRLHHFDSPDAAGRALQEKIIPGDLILVKGSQGMRMEKVVEEIMAQPLRAFELLCRQSADWKKKPFVLP